MTRGIFAILGFLFLNITFAQNGLKGIWIGKNLQYLSVNDSIVSIELGDLPESFKCKINNQLILKETFEIMRRTNDSIYHVPDSTLYYFDYKLINNDSLQLTLDSVQGMSSHVLKKQYNFNRKSSLKKANINFQSIFFSGTTCMGTCPRMKIEIDSLGNVKFKGEKYTLPYIGNYIGKLQPSQMESLIDLLNASELDRFPKKLPIMMDAPVHQFIFRYNNIERKSSGSIVPYFNREIYNYLLNIYKEIELQKVDYEIVFKE